MSTLVVTLAQVAEAKNHRAGLVVTPVTRLDQTEMTTLIVVVGQEPNVRAIQRAEQALLVKTQVLLQEVGVRQLTAECRTIGISDN